MGGRRGVEVTDDVPEALHGVKEKENKMWEFRRTSVKVEGHLCLPTHTVTGERGGGWLVET